jgi:uncharacterized protein YndB with AHSA1/START domain
MTDRSVIHDTFSIERTYPATPSRVFAAFTSAQAKHAWGGTAGSDLEPGAGITEFDFRPGGRERTNLRLRGTHYLYDALYYDVVPDQRIVYSYEMYADGARISVSVATIELAKGGAGTVLTWTEQGVYLDGIDGAQAPALRVGGTTELVDRLGRYLTERPETKEI